MPLLSKTSFTSFTLPRAPNSKSLVVSNTPRLSYGFILSEVYFVFLSPTEPGHVGDPSQLTEAILILTKQSLGFSSVSPQFLYTLQVLLTVCCPISLADWSDKKMAFRPGASKARARDWNWGVRIGREELFLFLFLLLGLPSFSDRTNTLRTRSARTRSCVEYKDEAIERGKRMRPIFARPPRARLASFRFGPPYNALLRSIRASGFQWKRWLFVVSAWILYEGDFFSCSVVPSVER